MAEYWKRANAGEYGDIIRFIMWEDYSKGKMDIWDARSETVRIDTLNRRYVRWSHENSADRIYIDLLETIYRDFFIPAHTVKRKGDITIELCAMNIKGNIRKYIPASRKKELRNLLLQYMDKRYIPKFLK